MKFVIAALLGLVASRPIEGVRYVQTEFIPDEFYAKDADTVALVDSIAQIAVSSDKAAPGKDLTVKKANKNKKKLKKQDPTKKVKKAKKEDPKAKAARALKEA